MLRTAARSLAIAAFLVFLPFVVLVRGAVFLHQHHDWHPWLALVGAGALAAAVLSGYTGWAAHRMRARARPGVVGMWIPGSLVVAWCLFALFFLSRDNAKTDEVRSSFTAAHPLLRLAVSTLVLADRDAVITDMAREQADYARMGLPASVRSGHFPQADGWVHALDLRTADRMALRNWVVEWFFRAMGFRTLRHTGTADHLHVELPAAGAGP